MLIEAMNNGSVSYCGSTDYNFTGGSPSDIFIDVRKIYCPRCIWTEISLIWIQQCVTYYTYLYIFYAGISNARNETQIRKVLLSI